MDKSKVSSEFEIAPLRTLDDFILGSARFQVPNVKNLEKWGNRVVNNLLYYQTNYFLMAAALFTIIGVMYPMKMLGGILSIIVMFVLFRYCTKEYGVSLKKQFPLLGIILIIAGCYFIMYVFDSLVIFLLGILLPFCATFVHASLRLRNIKNKLINKMEFIGLQKSTPMSFFLQEIGIEQEFLS